MNILRTCENCTDCCKNEFSSCAKNGHEYFTPKEELVRKDCIKDFETIINNIRFEPNFEREKENFIFDMAITRYKEVLIERLEKYLKEINKE